MAQITWAVTLAGQTFEITLARLPDGGGFQLAAVHGEEDPEKPPVTLQHIHGDHYFVSIGDRFEHVCLRREGDGIRTALRGREFMADVEEARLFRMKRDSAVQTDREGSADVVAPMPGLVLSVDVTEGQEVSPGEGLAVIESMKMENEIKSPRAGIVESIAVETGSVVDRGDTLVRIVALPEEG
ncbi:acetyl-CoA carboxylase biotin carboxyl carrier protein subunit [Candidatus Zixiibacteriota bacterium]